MDIKNTLESSILRPRINTPTSPQQLSAATLAFGEPFSENSSSPVRTQRSSQSFHNKMMDEYGSPRKNIQGMEKSIINCLFRVRISGIQCRNLEGKKLGGKSDPFVEFYWDDSTHSFMTPTMRNDLNPNYKGVHIAFEYETSLETLREKYLEVKVFTARTFQSKSLLGYMKVDLWTVATGPVHHDHHLHGSENGRVVFNCYMEQCRDWDISITDIGVMMPPMISGELDRPEGHDFQEDAALQLKKYAVSYKCTIGTNETFYVGNTLKHAEKRAMSQISQVSGSSLAKLAALSHRVQRTHSSSSSESTGYSTSGNAGFEDSEAVMKAWENPRVVEWSKESDFLPPITRYSTFDDLMSATLTLEIRQIGIGFNPIMNDSDGGFLALFDKFSAEHVNMLDLDNCNNFDNEIRNTVLYGQTWLSLEKAFEDAIYERIKKKSIDLAEGLNNAFSSYASQMTSPACNDNLPSTSPIPPFSIHPLDEQNYTQQYVASRFEQSLTLKGHPVGVIYGKLIFKRIPDVRQLRCGVISENGISSSSSVIVASQPQKKVQRKLKVVLPVEAQRLIEKLQGLIELMGLRVKDDKEKKIRKATKILKTLQISHKASMLSWVYVSAEALDETKRILMKLWQFLLDNMRVRHYALRNIFYELLFYLVKRAELSDLPLLGFDSPVVTQSFAFGFGKTTPKLRPQDLECGLALRALLVETKYCILQIASIRGVMSNNLMFFVARMVSVLCFRLPSFGIDLYHIWADSYSLEPVSELAAEFQMHADADLFAMDGLEAHLDWRRFHKAIYDEVGEKVLRTQEEDAEDKYEVTSETWRQRFKRLTSTDGVTVNAEANTLNVLLVDQWLWYVLDTLAVLNQKISWTHLPGYSQVLQVFFMELKTQYSGWLAPSLYKLSCTMLCNPRLINPMTKFILRRTNVHEVVAVIGTVELLGVWMYMIRSWRVRLSNYRLSHLENNDRWNFHQDDQYSIPTGDEVSLLPPSYDYRFLCSALRILLECEHTQVLLTTLEFLYNCWDCFPERHADKLRFELANVFNRLFLHWNREVRHFYQTLLAFRALKPHAWTQRGSSFVDTPPHSRRQIDAVAADFKLSLETSDKFSKPSHHETTPKTRRRSFSANNLVEAVQKRLSYSSLRTSPKSPTGGIMLGNVRNGSFDSTSRRNSDDINDTSLSNSKSGSSLTLSIASGSYDTDNVSTGQRSSNDVKSSADGFNFATRRRRSVSEELQIGKTSSIQMSPKQKKLKMKLAAEARMDPNLQLQFHKSLEAVYAGAKLYLASQSQSGSEIVHPDLANKLAKEHVTWKKKGTLWKQAFLYKMTWQKKYVSLKNNRLMYSDSEGGPTKRELNVLGATITSISNQMDTSQGNRTMRLYCFAISSTSNHQKFIFSASSHTEKREWMEVLQQNAAKINDKENQNTSAVSVSDVGQHKDALYRQNGKKNPPTLMLNQNTSFRTKLNSMSGEVDPTDKRIPPNLLPYTSVAVKEWLDIHVSAMESESKLACGQPFQLPVLISKSSLYADDE